MDVIRASSRLVVRGLLLAGPLITQACAKESVRWDRPQAGATPARESWTPPAAPKGVPVCASSLVAARARGDTAYAAWWAPRKDSSAVLVVARSDDGGASWRPPEVADGRDRGRTGCSRPPPDMAVDSASGYVHVVYFLVSPDGPGVFFAHSMQGGMMFHSPVAIVYGERVSTAAVTAHGDTVAVAYENPNAATSQVWLALSHTTGHIFEQYSSASPASATATRPAVSLNGSRVAVSWIETARGGGPGTNVIRKGTVRW